MRTMNLEIVALALVAAACGSTDSPATHDGSTSATSTSAADSADATSPSTGTSGATGSDGDDDSSSSADTGAQDSTGTTPDGPTPAIPSPTGTCPAIVAGDVTFAPAGMPPRQVTLSLDGGNDTTSSLILYWHATGSAPLEAGYSLGTTLGEFTGNGGIVAAPYSDPAAGTYEWYLVNGSAKADDFLLADEIVACLAEAGMIDAGKIHSMGMSAGGLQTTAFSFLRSSYVASVAIYSGGLPPGVEFPDEDPGNPFAALIFFGGASDIYGTFDFAASSHAYYDALLADDRFAALCDHGGGHDIPLDAAPIVVEFFAAHPFGTSPSPYADGLPASFPAYCSL